MSTTEVQGACPRLGFRLLRAFERYVEGDYRALKEQEMRAEGIQKWTPKRSALLVQYCRSYVANFFKCQKLGNKKGAWQWNNQFLSPFFDRCTKNFEYHTLEVAAAVRKALSLRWKRPNLSAAERSATASILNLDVGYNSLDKNYGPILCFPGYSANCTMKMQAK